VCCCGSPGNVSILVQMARQVVPFVPGPTELDLQVTITNHSKSQVGPLLTRCNGGVSC
jgi:hypothetical protein